MSTMISLPLVQADLVASVPSAASLPDPASLPENTLRLAEDTGTLYVVLSGAWEVLATASSGTVTGAANVGTGAGVWKDLAADTLRFKSILSSNASIQIGVGGDSLDLTVDTSSLVTSVAGKTGTVVLEPGDVVGGNSLTGAYWDAAGLLQSNTVLQIDGDLQIMSQRLTVDVEDASGREIITDYIGLAPSEAAPASGYTAYRRTVELDPDSSGFEIGTNGAVATLQTLEYRHEGTSNIGGLNYVRYEGTLGNGTDPIDIGGINLVDVVFNVADGVNMVQGVNGFAFHPGFTSGVTSGNLYVNPFYDTADFDCPVNGYTSFYAAPQIAEVKNNAWYNGLSINPQIVTMAGNSGVNFISVNGSIETLGTGGFNGIFFNTEIEHLTENSRGIFVGGVSTDGDAEWAGVDVSASAINTTGPVYGLRSTVSSGLNRQALNILGHSNLSAEFQIVSGQGQQYGNVIGGNMIIPDATAITGTDLLGNNMAMGIDTGDATSSWTAASVVGMTTLGFVGQIVGAGTINGAINFCLNGFAAAHEGHIDRVNNFFAAGIPMGMGGTMDEYVQYYGDIPAGAVATDNWGIRIDDSASSGIQNALTRLAIDTTNKKVTNDSVGLEIGGTTKAFLNARMTSTQRDALTAVNGMVIYNSTINKLQVYAASAWVDLH